jgi:RNA polymerase sigma factor for flagellar operon FliA
MSSDESVAKKAVIDETGGYTRDELLEEYLPLIKSVARSLASRLPASVEVDDLASVGVMGLIDAISKFDPAKCTNFKGYARIRIKGAMIDELRSQDWVPRSVRQVAARIERQRRILEQELGRAALDDEIAGAMGVSDERYHELRDRALGTGMLAIEDIGVETGGETRSILEVFEDTNIVSPEEFLQDEESKRFLLKTIESLREREQLVVSLYYLRDLSLREIGTILGVTESRVSQIRSRAMNSLRKRLKDRKSVV